MNLNYDYVAQRLKIMEDPVVMMISFGVVNNANDQLAFQVGVFAAVNFVTLNVGMTFFNFIAIKAVMVVLVIS